MIHLAALRQALTKWELEHNGSVVADGVTDQTKAIQLVLDARHELGLAEAAIQAAERVQERRDDVVTITKPETFGPMIEALDNLNDALVALRAGGRHTP